MKVKYNKSFLSKLEDLLLESNFNLRYEKGNFKSGFCILNDKKMVIINKYYSLEGKVNCLMEIIKQIDLDISNFTDKSKLLYNSINQTELAF